MQAEKNLVYYDGSPFWDPLRAFARELGVGVHAIGRRLVALAQPTRPSAAAYYEVYETPSWHPIRLETYSTGILVPGEFVGILEPRQRFKPGLPLAKRLSRKCGIVRCITLSSRGERFFLYGRTVFEENILEWKRGLSIVVNELGEALGWGRGRIVKKGKHTTRLVEPVWDLGWYLRRGG